MISGSVGLSIVASLCAGGALWELARRPPRLRRDRRRHAPLQPVARWAALGEGVTPVDALLDAAGRTAVPDVAALCIRQRVGALLGGAWGGAVGLLMVPPVVALALALGGAALGRVLPIVTLRRAGDRRLSHLRDEAPELLDLLAVALGCGLPIQGALAASGRWSCGALAAGVARAAAEIERGAALEPTLARLLREHPTPELEAAVAILERSRRHGTAASAPLRALAQGARQARARRATEHAARAAPKVQLVSALLLVPAALCVMAAGIVAGGVG